MPTRIHLDDRAFSPSGTVGRTLGDVVEEVRAAVAGDRRVIVGVVCDGIDVSGDDLNARLAEPVERFERVDLRTGQPEQLVGEAMRQALGLLSETDRRREQAVDALTRGDQQEATQALGECFRNWSQIHQGIAQSLAFLELDTHTFTVNGQPLESALAAIGEQLTQVRESLQAGDNVMLADTLQYELGESANTWKAAMEAILAHIAPDAAT